MPCSDSCVIHRLRLFVCLGIRLRSEAPYCLYYNANIPTSAAGDHFRCADCDKNRICFLCALHCHKGHRISISQEDDTLRDRAKENESKDKDKDKDGKDKDKEKDSVARRHVCDCPLRRYGQLFCWFNVHVIDAWC